MLDVLYRLDRLPEEDTKVFAREFQTRPGGPALNAAVTHALLGGQGLLVSAVGGGPGAVVVRGELERHGIQLLDLAAGTAYETPLATAWVNSANGSRTVVNPPASDVKMRRLDGPWEAEVGTLWGEMPPVVLSDGLLHATVAIAPIIIATVTSTLRLSFMFPSSSSERFVVVVTPSRGA